MINESDTQKILEIAAQAFTKAAKRSRNDQGRGHVDLGAIVQKWLLLHNMSQGDLAHQINKHQTFVNKVINGERGISIETLAAMTHVLGADFGVSYLDQLYVLKYAGEIQ